MGQSEDPGRLSSPGGLRVLVVEDNEDSAELLAAILEFYGHKARVVHDGAAAIAAAHDFAPDVVLCDIGLPGMDGYTVAERLHKERPGMKLIAITGYGQSEDRQRTAKAGFAYHLVKPVEAEDLRSILTDIRKQ